VSPGLATPTVFLGDVARGPLLKPARLLTVYENLRVWSRNLGSRAVALHLEPVLGKPRDHRSENPGVAFLDFS